MIQRPRYIAPELGSHLLTQFSPRVVDGNLSNESNNDANGLKNICVTQGFISVIWLTGVLGRTTSIISRGP